MIERCSCKSNRLRFEVVVQCKDTPKAFANFSPGLELATTLGHERKEFNAESVGQIALANAFSVGSVLSLNPGLKQPWAEISERLRRIFKTEPVPQ